MFLIYVFGLWFLIFGLDGGGFPVDSFLDLAG